MRRILWMSAVYAALVIAAIRYAQSTYFDDGLFEGQKLFLSRADFPVLDEPVAAGEIFWLGDSTLMLPGGYAEAVTRQLPPAVAWRASIPGFDVFGHYFLLEAVLDRQPRLIVEVANLRLLAAPEMKSASLLSSMLPVAELPRAVTLPLTSRGVTAPSLLLAQLLRDPWWVEQVQWFQGIRECFQNAAFWGRLGPTSGPVFEARERRDFLSRQGLRVWRFLPSRREAAPAIRLFGENARRARERGISFLAIVGPAPVHAMPADRVHHPERLLPLVQSIRETVEGNGGVVLDLHDALGADDFRDLGGHLAPTGTNRMVELVVPVIRRILASK